MKHQLLSFLFISLTCSAQDATVTIHCNQQGPKINKEIYGQFAEHLGSCIYGGLWVGPNSSIPNTDGYRTDVFNALKELQIPVLRWPGGCFADDYHWMDGIGPRDQRPSLRNNNWGGTIEDNSFGTHEFLNLCEKLGCEPYISGNVGSGTVKEMAQWVEYMTSDGDTPMARLRRKNGRDKAWHVKYFGIGNEAWGCGGNMTPEYYSNEFRRFNTYLRGYNNNKLFRIASGASDYDYNWTNVLMKNIGNRMNALSVHYYTVKDWNHKGKSSPFTPEEYYLTLQKCLDIDSVITKHSAIMNQTDPEKTIGLMVDEWGTWWDEEPGTIPGHLYQQNTLRDAMVAALSLNVFHKHADRVKMANIAQVVNVLQSMILTDTKGNGHMVLTPTYYVFKMYKPFQNATSLPSDVQCSSHTFEKGLPIANLQSSSAKTTDGTIIVSLANIDLQKGQEVALALDGYNANSVCGEILTAKNITDYNDFNHTETIKSENFTGAKIKKNQIMVKIPAKSIVVLKIK
mgnify:FL=1